MILTGNAKKDFGLWLKKHLKLDDVSFHQVWLFFIHQNKIYQNALIIEFFDGVGIYVGFYNTGLFLQCYINNDNIGKFKSRQEATEQAIKKVNEIYNNK